MAHRTLSQCLSNIPMDLGCRQAIPTPLRLTPERKPLSPPPLSLCNITISRLLHGRAVYLTACLPAFLFFIICHYSPRKSNVGCFEGNCKQGSMYVRERFSLNTYPSSTGCLLLSFLAFLLFLSYLFDLRSHSILLKHCDRYIKS